MGGSMKRGFFFFVLCLSLVLLMYQNTFYKNIVSEARLKYPSNIKRESMEVSVSGELIEGNWTDDSVLVRIKSIGNQKVNYKWLIYPKFTDLWQGVDLENGIAFNGTVNVNTIPFTSTKNPKVFDYDKYLYSKGINGKYTVEINTVYSSNQWGFNAFIIRVRNKMNHQISELFSTEQAQLVNAVIFGERDQLENYDAYKRLGLAHLFAISGLHFGILFSSISFVTKGMPRVARFSITSFLMLILLLIIGAPYSAQRAFFIILYKELSFLFRRKKDVLMSIAFSLLGILILQPYAILSTSLYLSYYAYLAIVIIYPLLPVPKFKNKLVESIKFSIAIQLILLPISIYYFNSVNLLSFFANLIYIPLIGLFLPFSLLSVLFAKLPVLSFILKTVVVGLSSLMQFIVSVIPYIESDIHLYYLKDFSLVLILLFALVVSFVFWRLHKNRVLFLTIISCSLILCALLSNNSGTQVIFYDVGHGDMVLIKDDDFSLLIDTGDGRNDAVSLLRANGITQLDYLVLSHDHNDHTGGFESLRDKIAIDTIFVTDSFFMSQQSTAREDGSDLSGSNLNVSVLNRSMVLEHNRIRLTLVPISGKAYLEDPNEEAIITKLEVQDEVIYFLADIYDDMIDSVEGIEKATIVKTAHHGSKTSISNQLYNSASLKLAISSCNYKYTMPSKALESTLDVNHTSHMTTYTYGQIQLNFSHTDFSIETYLN